jgi:hypothetical protein
VIGRFLESSAKLTYRFLVRACAFCARVLGLDALRMAFRWRFEARLIRPELPRVDLRDGRPSGVPSSAAPPFLPARFDSLRDPLGPTAALRSVALTPGLAVST